MKISYNWLKSQFNNLPSPDELADKITFGVFEVESVDKIGDDTIIDLKILPDRAHYALSWNGIAYEVGALIGQPYSAKQYGEVAGADHKVDIEVRDSKLCPRYMARYVGGVAATDSPKWLKDALEGIGQRSINSLVDLANYVMFITGQPLHIFDADKVANHSIIVRPAETGEKIDCLDGNTYELGPDNLLIADASGPLVVAGVKGGRRAEVTAETKNIIIESAGFNYVSVRKTSAKLKLKSEASKRYENEPSAEMCSLAMTMISSLVADANASALFGEINDVYPNPEKTWEVKFSRGYVSSRIGRDISDADILASMKLIQCEVISATDGVYIVKPPFFRFDLKIEEDFVEEVGRLLGYDKVTEVLPPKIAEEPNVNGEFYVSERIKDYLVGQGFSEVILYTLGEKGSLKVSYPVAEDKDSLRTSLLNHLEESAALNLKNADLLGLDEIKEFEVGKVFSADGGERLMLGLAVGLTKKQKGRKLNDELLLIAKNIGEVLGAEIKLTNTHEVGLLSLAEFSLEEVLSSVSVKSPYEYIDFSPASKNMFAPFSKYPFSTRDVAVFVPATIAESEVEQVVRAEAGGLCVRLRLFDRFEKEGKVSYAFRLVFQSNDHTLTEEEINAPLNKVYEALKNKGWEIR